MADLKATVESGLTARYEKLAVVLRELAVMFGEDIARPYLQLQ